MISDIFSVCLKTIEYLTLNCYHFVVGILLVLSFEFQKFMSLEILNFHPCILIWVKTFCKGYQQTTKAAAIKGTELSQTADLQSLTPIFGAGTPIFKGGYIL